MKTLNYKLLQDVQKLYKTAYVIPPTQEQLVQMQQQQQAQPPELTQQSQPSPEELMPIIQQGLSEGASPEEIGQAMVSKGIPQEMVMQLIQQVMESQGGSEAGTEETVEQEEQQPPVDLRAVMDDAIENERKKQKEQGLPPEEKLFIIDKKLDILTDIVQELLSGMPPKQGSYDYAKMMMDTLKKY